MISMILMATALWIFLILLYFIPTYVAYFREVKVKTGILILNIFVGWTFLGWVIALVWAVVARKN